MNQKKFLLRYKNKLHFAIIGKTAAEIIQERVSCKKDHMGLTSWRRLPNGKVMPSDVVIAKNYLEKNEISSLNIIVNMYLDYAEMQAARHRAMTMCDWIDKLNAFLKFSEHEILTDAGKISHEVVTALALKEYEEYRKIQDREYISDFDREVKKLLKPKNGKKRGCHNQKFKTAPPLRPRLNS